ncbi:hypothetical protein BCR44DRAFT_57208 [Catenaria anguillulae PL171]|uniref:Uncharacterized protein n=1 Tax=Catenaria anguillulae PL171 TaxID=765915 RepID=A0A1Y2HCN8_9FUNG|nr:hypothetical protein BCR44DRAFT_57208 [Catenaria anguillulae PL171]
MHFALHYDESIDNTGPAPATWLFRFEQANGEFVSLNDPGRQMPEVVMRAFIVERAADLFLAKPAHAHNEHELELLASAVKSRQPTRRAADLIFRRNNPTAPLIRLPSSTSTRTRCTLSA